MIKQFARPLAISLTVASLLLGATACQPSAEGPDTADEAATEETADGEEAEGDEAEADEAAMPGEGVTVKAAHSSLQEERFQTLIVDKALEELGYETEEPAELEYPAMHLAIADGDLTYTAVHWEKLHTDFFEQSGGDEELERVAIIVPNVLQGYQIDKATADEYDITNVEQLQDPEIAALFDSDGDGKANLTGCNPGWGCELVIEHHMDAYELRDTVQHDQGQYSALIADTLTRYDQGEPVLYYTWTPLWVAGVLKPDEDVVWLEVSETDLPEAQGDLSEEDTTTDGKNLGFAVDQMWVLTSDQFLEENPAAAKLFEMIQIPIEDINAQNQLMQDGEDSQEDIQRHAEEWIEENREQFDEWVEAARSAA